MWPIVSGNAYFCSIECCRHSGCEPTRMLIGSESLDGRECTGCGMPLDLDVEDDVC